MNFLEDQGKKGQDVSLNNFLVCILKDGQQILGARREREGRKMGFRENCKKTIDFFHQKWNIKTLGFFKSSFFDSCAHPENKGEFIEMFSIGNLCLKNALKSQFSLNMHLIKE